MPGVVLIAQSFSSNSSLTDDLRSLVPVYARIVRDYPNVRGILGFSGSGRATGLQDHPELVPLWAELFAGITGQPPVQTVTPPQPPPEVPMDKAPSVGQWINVELPQVVEAWRYGQVQPPDAIPSFDWAAFMAWRRFSGWLPGSGENWSLQRLIDNERAQRPAGVPQP